jgi:hypothetical protein
LCVALDRTNMRPALSPRKWWGAAAERSNYGDKLAGLDRRDRPHLVVPVFVLSSKNSLVDATSHDGRAIGPDEPVC